MAKIRYIYIPSVKRIIQLNLILNISGAISVFEIPYIMTGGSNGSSTFVIETIKTAFTYNKVGKASAMAVIVMLIVAAVALIQNIFFKEEKSMQSSTQINATKARMDKEVLALRAKSIFLKH